MDPEANLEDLNGDEDVKLGENEALPTEDQKKDFVEDTVESEERPADEDVIVSREQLIQQYKDVLSAKAKLEKENKTKQAKLVSYFNNRHFHIPSELSSKSKEEYHQMLGNIKDNVKKVHDHRTLADEESAKFKAELSEMEQELADVAKKLSQLRRNIAKKARHGTTGLKIDSKEIDLRIARLEASDIAKRIARLELIRSKNALDETKLKQSRIEEITECSMSLNEYEIMVGETNHNSSRDKQVTEDIEKMEKKCIEALNVMIHLKQKLFQVKQRIETSHKTIERQKMEGKRMNFELTNIRKNHEATTKKELAKVRRKFAMLEDDSLVENYNCKKEKCKFLENQLAMLQLEYRDTKSS